MISGHNGKIGLNSNEPILGPEASAELRDRLVVELKDLGSADDAAMWAHRCLGEKNKLTAADALRLEDAFQARLANLATGDTELQDFTYSARTEGKASRATKDNR